jgi:hypothetical protein
MRSTIQEAREISLKLHGFSLTEATGVGHPQADQHAYRSPTAGHRSVSGSKADPRRYFRMKPAAFALLLIAAVPTIALSKPRPSLVPPGWTEVYKDAATRTRRFKSADGAVTLTARQTPAGRDRAADLDEVAFRPGETITYQRRGQSWIAVSGYRGDDIFYRKSNLACGDTRWNNIEFIYPRADKKRLDAIVTAVARGMTRFSRDCS